MRFLKWISLAIAALVVLLLVAVLVLVWLVDPNGFKPRIEAAVKDATGRDFALEGDIELGFFPWLALRTGRGHFGNAPGFGADPMVRWNGAEIGAKLIPLLRGELVARRVQLDGAEVVLVRSADGRANWQGIGGDAPPDPNAEPMSLRIDGVTLTDSRVYFVDESASRRLWVEKLNISTDTIAEGTPFTDTEVAGFLHMDGFAPAGLPFRIDVPSADVAWDLSRVSVPRFEVALDGLILEGAVDGAVADTAKFSGQVQSNEFDPRALLKAVGVDAPKTTDPKALGRVKLTADWKLASGALAVDSLVLDLDDTHLSGSAALGADGAGEFSLTGNRLDLARYLPPPDPDSEPFKLPTAMLKGLKIRGAIELDEATLDDTVLKGVTLRLVMDEQGLHQEPAK